MAKAQTRDFELFTTITATVAGSAATIDLNEFVDVADMEAFGLEGVEVGINATEATPETSEYMCQIALQDLSGNFIDHASYNSLYLTFADATTGFSQSSLSLGNVDGVRYIPGGTLYLRADRINGVSDVSLYVRLVGKIATLSAKDYMALALTKAQN